LGGVMPQGEKRPGVSSQMVGTPRVFRTRAILGGEFVAVSVRRPEIGEAVAADAVATGAGFDRDLGVRKEVGSALHVLDAVDRPGQVIERLSRLPAEDGEVAKEFPDGAPDHVVRTVSENARTLKFETHGFEEE